MPRTSAGILPYRIEAGHLEVLLVHPGGPFWAKKDLGSWSIAKGEYEDGEDPLQAALREFSRKPVTGQPGHSFRSHSAGSRVVSLSMSGRPRATGIPPIWSQTSSAWNGRRVRAKFRPFLKSTVPSGSILRKPFAGFFPDRGGFLTSWPKRSRDAWCVKCPGNIFPHAFKVALMSAGSGSFGRRCRLHLLIPWRGLI